MISLRAYRVVWTVPVVVMIGLGPSVGAAPAAASKPGAPPGPPVTSVHLPEGSLWTQDGRVCHRGSFRLPPALQAAAAVARLIPITPAELVWTEERRDADGNVTRFRMCLANLRTAKSEELLSGADPFAGGPDWRLLGVNLTPDRSALIVRIRMSGSGGFSAVHRVRLKSPHVVSAAPESTCVWDSRSASGDIRVTSGWALATRGAHLADNQRKYATLIVGDPAHPRGRPRWQVADPAAIPAWAQRDISSCAVAPDGKSAAYLNPIGLWKASLRSGATPARQWPTPAGEHCTGLVWARDGQGVFFTRQPSGGKPSLVYVRFGTARAQLVLAGAENLCLLPAR